MSANSTNMAATSQSFNLPYAADTISRGRVSENVHNSKGNDWQKRPGGSPKRIFTTTTVKEDQQPMRSLFFDSSPRSEAMKKRAAFAPSHNPYPSYQSNA